ncbi:major facilitator superfamily domain-containing protein 6-like isoform X2 [Tubulanus polymorphus]|uniref:major facilitator superfamily domain-containing protein 6-like isoform X2 n=1 Tax=Tubulanus polymorphus TaxID=672921 RepID=UPI003DA52550
MGLCNGFIWGFLYWHLENLGATQMLLGIVICTTYICEFTMFFFVDRLVLKPFGCIGTLYLALVCYCMRFTTYAIIEDPWLVIPAEMLQALTFSAVWSSMTRYSIQTVPKDSLATMQGIIHGVYWGLGLGSGHLIGGVMMSRIGAHKTFGCMGLTSIMVLILFAIAQHFSEKPAPIVPEEETVNKN